MTKYYTNHPIHAKVYREPLLVGTVAGICRVTRKTIINWINQGAIKSFTTHGGHNRIWPADLRAFLDLAGIDVEFRFDDKRQTRFLIVNDKLQQRNLLLESICDRFPHASVVATQSKYEALLLVGEQKPHVVTWDLNMPRFDGIRIIEFLQERRVNASIHVTLCHHTSDEELQWCAYAGAVQKNGTGISHMLNSLQTLLTDQSPSSRRETARPTEAVLSRLRESSRIIAFSN